MPLRSQDFTPRMRAVLSQVMRDAYIRNKGNVPPERRMRFNPREVWAVQYYDDYDNTWVTIGIYSSKESALAAKSDAHLQYGNVRIRRVAQRNP